MSNKLLNKREMSKIIKRIKKGFSTDKRQYKIIEQEIVKQIKSGNSPVKGFKKYQKYSKNYKIGRKRPVNLTVTGKMLKSLIVRSRKTGRINIFFKSKIAKYHDDEGRVLRRMLPWQNGEEFKATIMNKIKKRILKLFK